jgi:tetratricopeptide (TPR) repeat protein
MLETIREFATERLEERGEAEELRRRHAEAFLALAEEAEPPLRRDSPEWADRLEREHDNLRAALDWLETAGDTQLRLRLAAALMRFWYLKSHLMEGQRRLEGALRADSSPTAARGKALNGAAVMALNLGDIPKARLRAEEALALHRTLGEVWGIAYSEFMVANAVAEGGDLASAQQLYEESIRIFRELGEERYAVLATSNLAWVIGDLGDRERERALQVDILHRSREMGNVRLEADALAQLALFARDEGRLGDAESMLREAIRMDHNRGDVLRVAIDLRRLASVLAHAKHARAATLLLSSSEALMEGLGASVPFWAGKRKEDTRTIILGHLDEAAFSDAWDRGRTLTFDEAVALALDSPD